MEVLLINTPHKTAVFDTYWEFAFERQNIFWNRYYNNNKNTSDPILRKYKFTNCYRVNDRVSQYLLRNIIYESSYTEEDLLFRILFFKTFNNIDTWKNIKRIVGDIKYSTFNIKDYNLAFDELHHSKRKIYSGAYIMPSGKAQFGHKLKYKNHLDLLDYMMKDKLMLRINHCHSLKGLFHILLDYPTIGKFLAFQYSIDINYSDLTNFSEMDFVIAGPGASSGIRKCFSDLGTLTEEDIIKYMSWHQHEEFERRNLNFRYLGDRPLQLIDCQNLFCETDKYARVKHPDIIEKSGRKRIKQLYHPDNTPINYMYPSKWNIII